MCGSAPDSLTPSCRWSFLTLWTANGAVCVFLLVLLVRGKAGADERAITRRTGWIQSVRPHDVLLMLEQYGSKRKSELLRVRINRAEIVRIWRDPADPWFWRERGTSIYRWPVGTFVMVIGSDLDSGSFEASRVEIPKLTSE